MSHDEPDISLATEKEELEYNNPSAYELAVEALQRGNLSKDFDWSITIYDDFVITVPASPS